VFYITCKCASVELGGTGATALKCLKLLIRIVFFLFFFYYLASQTHGLPTESTDITYPCISNLKPSYSSTQNNAAYKHSPDNKQPLKQY